MSVARVNITSPLVKGGHLWCAIIWFARGINAARIKTISYGKERPAAVGSNEAAWAKIAGR